MNQESTPPHDAPELLLRHAGLVRGLARRLLRDEALAEDVAQETWIAALARWPRSAAADGSEQGVRAFLARTARRIAQRSLTRGRHRREREQSVARPEASGEVRAEEDEAALRRETLDRIHRAVLEMEEPFRETLLLRFYGQATPSEIARRHGVPRDTVYSRIRRGLGRLRERLAEDHGGGSWNRQGGLLLLARGAGGVRVGAPGPATTVAPTTVVGAGTLGLGATMMSTPMKWTAGIALLGIGALCWWRPPGVLTDLNSSTVAVESELEVPDQAPVVDEEPGLRSAASAPLDPPTAEGSTPRVGTLETGRLVLEVLYTDTGLPAVGRRFDLLEWDRANPAHHGRQLETDVHGVAELDELLPGTVLLYDRIGGATRAEIVAGEETLLQHRVPRGIDLRGRVEDPDGQPLPGAEIWLSEYGNDDEGAPVAESDGRGEFELRCIGPHRSIAAFQGGLAPTRLHPVTGNPGDAVELTLVLEGTGAWVEGIVTTRDGTPLVGIEVRAIAIESGGVRPVGPDGVPLGRRPPASTRTDSTGFFELRSLPVGELRLWTSSPEHAPWIQELELRAGEVERLGIVLEPAGRLVGTVTDVEGRPVAGARLETGDWGRPDHAWTRSGRDGSYTLAPLAPGPRDIRVSLDDVGSRDARVEVLAGAPTPWDPCLDPGRILEGTVAWKSGAPLAGAELRALSLRARPGTRSLWSREVELDAEGAFRILACPEGPLTLEVYRSPGDPGPLGRMREFHAGESPLHWVLERDDTASAEVLGSARTAQGDPLRGEVWIAQRGGGASMRTSLDVDAGRFRFEGLPGGTYDLGIAPSGSPRFLSQRFELNPGEILDLGELNPPATGSLVVRVVGSEGLDPFERIEFVPTDADSPRGIPHRLGTNSEPTILIAGTYRWTAWGSETAMQTASIEVRPGQTSVLEIEAREGIPCSFHVEATPNSGAIPLVSYVLFGDDTRPMAQWHRGREDGFDSEVQLLPGRYRIRATTFPDRSAELEFEVVEGDEPKQFRLDLE